MNIWYLYFLLPAFLFPLSLIIATSLWRKIWARKLSLYRQFSVTIIGLPIWIGILKNSEVFLSNLLLIFYCGILWAIYLTIAFYATNLTTVWISRSFVTISRTLSSFVIWYILFSENISYFDIIWMLTIFIGVYFLSNISKEKLLKNDILGILFSFLWGIIFTLNNLVFKDIWNHFSFIEAAYILEASSLIPLFILYVLTHNKNDFIKMRHDSKNISIMLFTAPLILIASYWLAQSIQLLPFYIFNTLFVLTLIISVFFSWLFLWEKISQKRLISISIMILGCSIIVFI